MTPGTFLLTHGHLDPVALPPQEPTGLAAEAEVHHIAPYRGRLEVQDISRDFKTFRHKTNFGEGLGTAASKPA